VETWKLAATGLLVVALTAVAQADNKIPLCSTKDFPVQLQNQLKDKFGSWKIQDESSLALFTKQRWQSEKPLECPGIAMGSFESADHVSFALLLVPKNNADAAYKLVLFTRGTNESSNAIKVVEEWDKGGASHYFVHKTEISKFLSRDWVTKLHVKTNDGILIFDAAESEYGTDIYFWADGQYRHQWVDY
jgi:hypothetical protein